MSTELTHTQAIIDAARAAGAAEVRPLSPTEQPLVNFALPPGWTTETMDLSKYLDAPQRAKGKVTLKTVDDFARYVTRHDSETGTTVWADIDTGQLVAVLDDHSQEAAGWGEHRAALTLKAADEWKHWASLDGQLVDQERFAEHVQDGMPEIVEPGAADLLDIVTTMQGHTRADWKSGMRLRDGSVQFVYSEDATATAGGAGELTIPETFTLGIAPFLGEEAYKLTARLRYRVNGGNLLIGYKLERPNDVVRDAIDDIANGLATRFGEDRVFIGVPR